MTRNNILSLLVALILFSLAITSFAQDLPPDPDTLPTPGQSNKKPINSNCEKCESFKEVKKPLIDNPIQFVDLKAPIDGDIQIKVYKNEGIDENSKLNVCFTGKDAKGKTDGRCYPIDKVSGSTQKVEDKFYTFNLKVPRDIKEWKNAEKIFISAEINDGTYSNYERFQISNSYISIIAALVVVLIFLWLIPALVCKAKIPSSFWISPLRLTITPLRRYSISLLQILMWTSITIFAYVYVYWLRGEFLVVSDQILVLLGISGGTALSAKAIALAKFKEVPERFFTKYNSSSASDDINKNLRTPKFSDYICIGGIPNIFKFQILAFTLITGAIVVWEVITSSSIPLIPENILTLMLVSSGVYVGNEVATENAWKNISQMVSEADANYEKLSDWYVELAQYDATKTLLQNKKVDTETRLLATSDPQVQQTIQAQIDEVEQQIVNVEANIARIETGKDQTEKEYEKQHNKIYQELEKIYV